VRTLFIGMLILSTVVAPAVAADSEPPVTVTEHEGAYSVTATFTVDQPASVAVAVLTDYDNISRFMPDVHTSNVLERSGGRAIVEQEASSRLLMFSKRVHLVLEASEEPGTIRFRDTCGRSFARYEGAWKVTQRGNRAAISYELTAKPTFDVPEFVLKRLLKRNAQQMIERLQEEMAARASLRRSE
jgi:carbon monoxide dehydrogenase subunit G